MMNGKGLRREQGFSLVEACLVIGVVAVLVGIAVPSLSDSMRGMQLLSDARSIASALATAKMSATSQMTPYRISINTGTNQWTFEKFDRTTSDFDVEQTNLLSSGVSGSGIAFRATSGTALSGFPSTTSGAVTFNSRGIPIDAAGVPTANNVIYISKSDIDLAVSVSLSGKVQMWRLEDGQWNAQ